MLTNGQISLFPAEQRDPDKRADVWQIADLYIQGARLALFENRNSKD